MAPELLPAADAAAIEDAAGRLRGMRRILLVGCSGAGKTTLAARMSEVLGLPFISLDQHFWKAGWVETPDDEWDVKVRELVDAEAWVMDGNYSRTFLQRVVRAEAVIFLDLPRSLVMLRVLRRILRHFGRVRPHMPAGCPERFDFVFLQWVWNYPRRSRPKILEAMSAHAPGRLMLRLTRQADADALLEHLRI
jgi:adenylate kinase family enzyme